MHVPVDEEVHYFYKGKVNKCDAYFMYSCQISIIITIIFACQVIYFEIV